MSARRALTTLAERKYTGRGEAPTLRALFTDNPTLSGALHLDGVGWPPSRQRDAMLVRSIRLDFLAAWLPGSDIPRK